MTLYVKRQLIKGGIPKCYMSACHMNAHTNLWYATEMPFVYFPLSKTVRKQCILTWGQNINGFTFPSSSTLPATNSPQNYPPDNEIGLFQIWE